MEWVKAFYPFRAIQENDLSFNKGDLIYVVNRPEGNQWWQGEREDGVQGVFPSNYVKVLPLDPEFEPYRGKEGIFSLDIIQFNNEDDTPMINNEKCLSFIICGDGEFVIEASHDEFSILHKSLSLRFPSLELPNFPSINDKRDKYKCLIHDYFNFLNQHPMTVYYTLLWLDTIDRVRTSPCPKWEIICKTTYIPSAEEKCDTGYNLISIQKNEIYYLLDIIDGRYLEIQNSSQHGWCALSNCEILYRNNTNLARIFPFTLPSIELCDNLHLNKWCEQSLFLNEQCNIKPTQGDSVALFVECFIWNSIRGYMYEIMNVNKEPLYHVIGEDDTSIITPMIDKRLVTMRQGEKRLLILHSSIDMPKEILYFMMNCKEFYLGYCIEIRRIQRSELTLPSPNALRNALHKRHPATLTKFHHIGRYIRNVIQYNLMKDKQESLLLSAPLTSSFISEEVISNVSHIYNQQASSIIKGHPATNHSLVTTEPSPSTSSTSSLTTQSIPLYLPEYQAYRCLPYIPSSDTPDQPSLIPLQPGVSRFIVITSEGIGIDTETSQVTPTSQVISSSQSVSHAILDLTGDRPNLTPEASARLGLRSVHSCSSLTSHHHHYSASQSSHRSHNSASQISHSHHNSASQISHSRHHSHHDSASQISHSRHHSHHNSASQLSHSRHYSSPSQSSSTHHNSSSQLHHHTHRNSSQSSYYSHYSNSSIHSNIYRPSQYTKALFTVSSLDGASEMTSESPVSVNMEDKNARILTIPELSSDSGSINGLSERSDLETPPSSEELDHKYYI